MTSAAPVGVDVGVLIGTRGFVMQALRCLLTQDYPRLELIVVDDGERSIAELLPVDRRVRYFRLPGPQTIGAKRNFACRQAAAKRARASPQCVASTSTGSAVAPLYQRSRRSAGCDEAQSPST